MTNAGIHIILIIVNPHVTVLPTSAAPQPSRNNYMRHTGGAKYGKWRRTDEEEQGPRWCLARCRLYLDTRSPFQYASFTKQIIRYIEVHSPVTLVAPATAKGPTGRHGGLTRRRRLLRFASLHGKKSYIQRRQQRHNKSGEKEKWNPKRRCQKKKNRGGLEKVGL